MQRTETLHGKAGDASGAYTIAGNENQLPNIQTAQWIWAANS